jgi:hypothetical protein
MKFYCGIDLGARKTHVCLIDEEDHKLLDMKMDNNLGVIEAALRPYKSSLEVVAESTINWEWLVYGLDYLVKEEDRHLGCIHVGETATGCISCSWRQ